MKQFLFAAFLLLSACATPQAPSAQHFSGTLYWGFETSAFRTDDGQGPYWLTGDEVWPQVVAPLQGHGPWGRVHLVVEGELSPPGQYGHLGGYARELHVTRVIESRLVAAEPSGS